MAVPEVDSVEGTAAGGRLATAARTAHHEVIGRKRNDIVQSAADAVFPRRRLSAQSTAAVCGVFSPNTPEGACPNCHGIGRVHEVSEHTLVPDDRLTIRERAIAAWPTAVRSG